MINGSIKSKGIPGMDYDNIPGWDWVAQPARIINFFFRVFDSAQPMIVIPILLMSNSPTFGIQKKIELPLWACEDSPECGSRIGFMTGLPQQNIWNPLDIPRKTSHNHQFNSSSHSVHAYLPLWAPWWRWVWVKVGAKRSDPQKLSTANSTSKSGTV